MDYKATDLLNESREERLSISELAPYRSGSCPNCGRVRVQGPGSGEHLDGVCEKCNWDVDGGDYATITRPAAQCVECHGEIDMYSGRCDNWLSCSLAA